MTGSLRKAVDLKCKDCCYDDRSGLGTWRQQVEACVCQDCPLYPVRPKVYRKAAFSGHTGATRYPTLAQPDYMARNGLLGGAVGQKGGYAGEVSHG